MLGIPARDQPRFKRWSDTNLALAETVTGGPEAGRAAQEYRATTAEMDAYLQKILGERRQSPRDDLASKLANVVIDGERLTHSEIQLVCQFGLRQATDSD